MLKIVEKGGALYIRGQSTYPYRHLLRQLGGSWDAQERSWRFAPAAQGELEAVLAQLNDPDSALREQAAEHQLKRDRQHLLGTATHEGTSYYVVAQGFSHGREWVKLLTKDGMGVLFRHPDTVEFTSWYQRALSLEALRRLKEKKRTWYLICMEGESC